LAPETVRSYELVYEQYLPAQMRVSLSGFLQQTEDLIGPALDPVDERYYYGNLGAADSHGVEFEVEHQGPRGLRVRASYSWQQTKDGVTGLELSNAPRHLAKANVAVPLGWEKLMAGLEFQYSSRANTIAGRITPYADDYWVMNATLWGRELLKNLELSVTLYNLFDQAIAFPASDEFRSDLIEQDGRTFRVKATYRF
jgi:outer membrane receptor protein involved in Fe transport